MDLAPYDTPSYFPLSYFYGVNVSPINSTLTGESPYNAPTYFSPSYFYGLAAFAVPASPTQPTGRDGASYAAILSLLAATGVFQESILGAATQRSQAGSDSYPLVVLTPKGWEETDDYDPALILRKVSFEVTIVVKSQDGTYQINELDQLSSMVQKVIDRSDLGGTCLSPLTRIRAGRFDCSTHYPEQVIKLEGEFSSLIDL